MKWLHHCLFLHLALIFNCLAAPEKNEIPPDVVKALHAPVKVTLYSLEPSQKTSDEAEKLHGYKVLGHTVLDEKRSETAVKEFEKAVADWDGKIMRCFNPRHAIRIRTDGHTYDLLLCYECHRLYIYRDNDSPVSLGASGSSRILRGLLSADKIPLSSTKEAEEEITDKKKQR